MMTLPELRKILLSIDKDDLVHKTELMISLPHLRFSKTFTGISALYGFILNELTGWDKYSIELPSELKESKIAMERLRNEIVAWVKNRENSSNLISRLRNSISQLESQKHLLSGHPDVAFLVDLYGRFPKYFIHAYNYLIHNVDGPDMAKFTGQALAYEYLLKDHTEITKRRDNERAAISKIRNDFLQYLSESEEVLHDHFNAIKSEHDEHTKQIDELIESKNTSFEEWYGKSSGDFDSFFSEANEKIKELEITYQEKLKLEEPAKYWKDRSKLMRDQANTARGWLVGLVLFGCVVLAILLLFAPEQIYLSFFKEDKSAAIRWSIVFVTFISFLAFAIRAIVKVMFSAYHLASDCDERHTLTYFYLALLKDTTVDNQDRQLIMQSLFSRSDSGLLKDDGSPAMPGLVEKIISK